MSFQLSAATLDVEVQGIAKGGVLNLEICSSKEAFESDDDASGVLHGLKKPLARDHINAPSTSRQALTPLNYTSTKTKMGSLIQTF